MQVELRGQITGHLFGQLVGLRGLDQNVDLLALLLDLQLGCPLGRVTRVPVQLLLQVGGLDFPRLHVVVGRLRCQAPVSQTG